MIAAREIAESLLEDRTKKNVNRLLDRMDVIGVDLYDFLDEVDARPMPVKWYLTWTLTHYFERNPIQDLTLQKALWERTIQNDNPSIDRDYWRAWSFINVNEEIAGEIYESAVVKIMSSKVALAVRAHAMLCAYRIAEPYPELCSELLSILEGLKQDEAPAICSRSRNLSKKLERKLKHVNG